jgi:hypothetical protein
MELYVRNRVCLKAILQFMQEVARQTALKPRVRLARTPVDVEFGPALDQKLIIEWNRPGPEDAADDSEEDDRPGSTIEHYEKTIRALAANAEAARALLDLAQGRQGRTGPAADRNAG